MPIRRKINQIFKDAALPAIHWADVIVSLAIIEMLFAAELRMKYQTIQGLEEKGLFSTKPFGQFVFLFNGK